MTPVLAGLLVFGASAVVLVLEILAVRLLAPYLGVIWETTTRIIGTVLAGIAVGTWLGGGLARSTRGASWAPSSSPVGSWPWRSSRSLAWSRP